MAEVCAFRHILQFIILFIIGFCLLKRPHGVVLTELSTIINESHFGHLLYQHYHEDQMLQGQDSKVNFGCNLCKFINFLLKLTDINHFLRICTRHASHLN